MMGSGGVGNGAGVPAREGQAAQGSGRADGRRWSCPRSALSPEASRASSRDSTFPPSSPYSLPLSLWRRGITSQRSCHKAMGRSLGRALRGLRLLPPANLRQQRRFGAFYPMDARGLEPAHEQRMEQAGERLRSQSSLRYTICAKRARLPAAGLKEQRPRRTRRATAPRTRVGARGRTLSRLLKPGA